MTYHSKEKIQAIKYVERQRRKVHFVFGVMWGFGSAFMLHYCIKRTIHKNPKLFHEEKLFYCSKFKVIKNALCDIKAHLQTNLCNSNSCEPCCCKENIAQNESE